MTQTANDQAKNTLQGVNALCGRMEAKGRSPQGAGKIVTRKGGNPQGFRRVAIEPGPEGIRPHSAVLDYGLAALFYVSLAFAAFMAGYAHGTFDAYTEAEAFAAALGGARDTLGGGAVPLGNTGTTTGEGAR